MDPGRLDLPVPVFGGAYGNFHATEALLREARALDIPAERMIRTGDTAAHGAPSGISRFVFPSMPSVALTQPAIEFEHVAADVLPEAERERTGRTLDPQPMRIHVSAAVEPQFWPGSTGFILYRAG